MNKSNNLQPVLCKYLGLTECGENGSNREVRLAPFKDGTFRATQPCALNDVLSETKCLSHFNTFSPADIKVTRETLKRRNWAPNFEPTEDDILRELKSSYNSESYTPDRFPGLFDGPAVSKNEFEQSDFLKAITAINSKLIDIISLNYGVLSLAQDCLDPLMWCHYGSNGKSICIEFDPEHPYFFENPPLPVSYNPSDRLHFSYFEGAIRINGVYIDASETADGLTDLLIKEFEGNYSEQQLKQAILYTKSEPWIHENEKRITYPLNRCKLVKRNCDGFFVDRAKAIYCVEIPFSAFKSVYLGYAISPEDREAVVNSIQQNCDLSHVAIFEIYPCPTGVLKKRRVS